MKINLPVKLAAVALAGGMLAACGPVDLFKPATLNLSGETIITKYKDYVPGVGGEVYDSLQDAAPNGLAEKFDEEGEWGEVYAVPLDGYPGNKSPDNKLRMNQKYIRNTDSNVTQQVLEFFSAGYAGPILVNASSEYGSKSKPFISAVGEIINNSNVRGSMSMSGPVLYHVVTGKEYSILAAVEGDNLAVANNYSLSVTPPVRELAGVDRAAGDYFVSFNPIDGPKCPGAGSLGNNNVEVVGTFAIINWAKGYIKVFGEKFTFKSANVNTLTVTFDLAEAKTGSLAVKFFDKYPVTLKLNSSYADEVSTIQGELKDGNTLMCSFSGELLF